MVLVLKAWRGSWRTAESWHHVAGSGSLKIAQNRLLVKEQPRSNGNPGIRETLAPWDEQQGA